MLRSISIRHTARPLMGADQVQHVVMPWLVRLRWVSLVALAVAAWAAQSVWQIRLPTMSLIELLAALAVTNAALALQLRSPVPRRRVIAVVLFVDIMILTGILYLVGGPVNPFGIVYLVGITIAAVSLGARWGIAFAVVSNVAYGVTFFYHHPLELNDPTLNAHILTLHLTGMWVAIAAASGLIAYFVGCVSEALSERERQLADARAATAKSDRQAALFALGAGAAHELATPLSTISTAAGELERTLQRRDERAFTAESHYIRVIRAELERCTTVLDQLSGRASTASATEAPVVLSRMVDDLRYRLGESLAGRLDVSLPSNAHPITVPAEPLRQALIALLRNAFDASAPDQRVTMRVDEQDGMRVEVVDQGRGMDDTEVARAGEPFFSTKPAGGGLGLGLFLVRAFVDQMGGTLRLRSTPGQGTSVTLQLPGRV